MINQTITFLGKLSKKDFEKFLGAALLGIALIAGSMIYIIRSKSEGLAITMTNLRSLARKVSYITQEYQTIQFQKKKLQDLLAKGKTEEFEIKSYFENFTRTNDVKPESDWNVITTPFPNNVLLEELSLKATFNNITMKKLVELLSELEKKEIVYIRDIKLSRKQGQTISCELTIATLHYIQAGEA